MKKEKKDQLTKNGLSIEKCETSLGLQGLTEDIYEDGNAFYYQASKLLFFTY